MAAYVKVPKDLSKIKNKIAFNLTKRQLICFGIGGVIGAGLYSLTKDILGISTAGVLMVSIMLPFFILGTYEKNGLTFEKIMYSYILQNFIFPAERPFATKNIYTYMRDQEKEEITIAKKVKRGNSTAKSQRTGIAEKKGYKERRTANLHAERADDAIKNKTHKGNDRKTA